MADAEELIIVAFFPTCLGGRLVDRDCMGSKVSVPYKKLGS